MSTANRTTRRGNREVGTRGHSNALCRVCLKKLGPFERRFDVRYRGAHYTVCCPSCVVIFKASPQDFLTQDLS